LASCRVAAGIIYRTSPSSASVIHSSPFNATTSTNTDRMLTLPIDAMDAGTGSNSLRPSSSSAGGAQLTDASRSSISTVDSEGRVGASMLSQMSKRWSTLETAGRCMFMLSIAFLAVGVVLTVVRVVLIMKMIMMNKHSVLFSGISLLTPQGQVTITVNSRSSQRNKTL